jgi:hypothetical protein
MITQRLVSKSTEKPKFIGRFDENDLQPSFEFRAGPRSVLNPRKRNAGVFIHSAVGATDPLVNIPDILCAVNLQLLLLYAFHFPGKNQEAADDHWVFLPSRTPCTALLIWLRSVPDPIQAQSL